LRIHNFLPEREEKMERSDWSSMIIQTQKQMQAMKGGGIAENKQQVKMVEIRELVKDEEQPRRNIDPESQEIKELSESIKQHGVINPISVRQEGNYYKIIAGERRFIASKAAGLEKVPVMVLNEKDKKECCLIQLAENIQRRDLTPLEEAHAYERLKEEFSIKGVELAEMIKKDKGYISKMLRIARIEESVQEDIVKNKNGVSKEVLVLLSSFNPEEQKSIWEKIRENPTETALTKEQLKLQVKVTKKRVKIQRNPKEVYDALHQMIEKKGIESILKYISPGKIKRLLADIEKESE